MSGGPNPDAASDELVADADSGPDAKADKLVSGITPSGGGSAHFQSLDLATLGDVLDQNGDQCTLTGSMEIAVAPTDDDNWFVVTLGFNAQIDVPAGAPGLIELELENLFTQVDGLNTQFAPHGYGPKAMWQGIIGEQPYFGFLANPTSTTSSVPQLLDMGGVPITVELQAGDAIAFNASWLIQNDD